MSIRVLLNGKKAGLEPVRNSIFAAREQGPVEVRTTWEAGDIERLVAEACREGCTRLVAGGGDGTVNEVADALLQLPQADRPELAILPLGTANDFATACGIPADLPAALELAASGSAAEVDAIRANDRHFINVASGGFAAEVTANTPVPLKNFLGGGAYTLSGMIQALNFVPYHGEFILPGVSMKEEVIVGAVCNGRQAGGGQVLAGGALIDDGQFDTVALFRFPPSEVAEVVKALRDPSQESRYLKRFKADWAEWVCDMEFPYNLDGEPMRARKIRFEVVPKSLRLIVPGNCPLLTANN